MHVPQVLGQAQVAVHDHALGRSNPTFHDLTEDELYGFIEVEKKKTALPTFIRSASGVAISPGNLTLQHQQNDLPGFTCSN